MNRLFFWWICALVWLPGWGAYAQEGSLAAPEVVGLSSEKLDAIPAAVQDLVEARIVSGAVVLVAKKGQIALLDAQGLRDVEAGLPMESNTLFRIYSMTKPITSVAVLMLMEQGRLELDDPVEAHLPELRELSVYKKSRRRDPLQRPVTIRDLLRHTSGMTYGFFGLGPVERLYMRDHPLFSSSQEEMLEKLSTLPLVEQPGTKWRYSVSTDVLGALVERVSGQSLGEFFQEHIFLPLSMEDTGFVVPDEKLDRFASVYGLNLTLLDAASSSAYRQSDRLQSGGGGLVSTASDYHRFCQMLLDGGVFDGRRLLKEETVAEMMRNQLPEGVRAYRLFGFGLGLQVQMKDWGVLAHRDQVGWNGVASTHFWISPRDDLIFIALSQRQPYSTQLKDVLTPLVYGALEP